MLVNNVVFGAIIDFDECSSLIAHLSTYWTIFFLGFSFQKKNTNDQVNFVDDHDYGFVRGND